MSTEPGDNGEMVKLNVKVPKRLLEELDKLTDELNYTNRSECIQREHLPLGEPATPFGVGGFVRVSDN